VGARLAYGLLAVRPLCDTKAPLQQRLVALNKCYMPYMPITGILLGIAVRTGSPLNLSLAEPVWKQLAGMALSVTDLNEIDKDYVPGFRCSRALPINLSF